MIKQLTANPLAPYWKCELRPGDGVITPRLDDEGVISINSHHSIKCELLCFTTKRFLYWESPSSNVGNCHISVEMKGGGGY